MAVSKDSISTQILVGAVGGALGAAIFALGGVVFGILDQPFTLPLWGYLTTWLVIVAGFNAVLLITTRKYGDRINRYREELLEWAARQESWNNERVGLSRQIQQANEDRQLALVELHEERALEFDDGLYYRKSDKEHKQPFCRLCAEENPPELRTVSLYYDRNDNLTASCRSCQQDYVVSIKPPVDDEDY